MSIIDLASLQAHLGGAALPAGAQGDLDIAERLCAIYVGAKFGSFFSRNVAEDHYINAPTRMLVFNWGPMQILGYENEFYSSQFTSLTRDGVTIAGGEYNLDEWTLELAPQSAQIDFHSGELIRTEYTYGYADDAEVPSGIKYAVFRVYDNLASSVASGTASERIGDYAISYHGTSTAAAEVAIDEEVRKLLKPFKQPGYL